MAQSSIPIIDLFAGPGGLGEGFSAYKKAKNPRFRIKLSIEKDPAAHKTLRLRSFYRQFTKSKVPQAYYDYILGKPTMSQEILEQLYPNEWAAAKKESWLAELGANNFPDSLVDQKITEALNGATEWMLIGGPPCQAYSVAGRSRRAGENIKDFENDHRHFLYRQYLRILDKFRPFVFIMENVKGLLSSKINTQFIFHRILKDLKLDGYYTIYSLTTPTDSPDNLKPKDFVIKTEEHSIPQSRHRIILLGVRNNSSIMKPRLLKQRHACSVYNMLHDLPKLNSKISYKEKSSAEFKDIIKTGIKIIERSNAPQAVKKVCRNVTNGRPPKSLNSITNKEARKIKSWLTDEKLKQSVLNHEPRRHISSDIHRYLFASCYAAAFGISPRLKDFPKALLPNHKNVQDSNGKTDAFTDRFRVQIASKFASTIVSHIGKDGHYYIHPDPTQCRSLTVREAARLQTFPDNYLFEGGVTQQYIQVGNAVPPYLALQIADVAAKLFVQIKLQQRQNNKTVAVSQ